MSSILSRQRQQGRDAAQFARRARAERARRGRRVRLRPASPASPCIRAPTGGTSRRRMCATSRGAADAAAARRVQHRGRSAARAAGAGAARSARISARWCRSFQARSRARPAGSRDRRRDRLPEVIARLQGARHSGQPVRRPRAGVGAAWPPRSAPIASSCTPSHSRGRSSRAERGARGRSTRMREAAQLAHSLGLGVNAGHDLDLDNLCSSASCRISTRCRSATPSCRARCSSASTVVASPRIPGRAGCAVRHDRLGSRIGSSSDARPADRRCRGAFGVMIVT